MKFRDNFRSIAAGAALALTMTLGTGVALAHPTGGRHGPGPADEMIGRLVAHARAQLDLNTSQQQMFDAAVASSKAARESARALRQNVKDVLQAELAKDEPDLAAVAAVAEAAADQARALRAPIKNEWLRLYATFSAEQKAVVRDLLQKRIARTESFRHRMRERMREYFDGASG